MSDINTTEMSRDELEATANDLGIKFQKNLSDDGLRQRIDEALGNPSQSVTNTPAPAEPEKAKRYKVTIHADGQDKQPVQVGVNGRMYVIKRGEEVIVPASVVEVLENAVQTQYDENMKPRHVLSYSFSAREV